MASRTVKINFGFFKSEVTLKQFSIAACIILFAIWIGFNLTFNITTDFFSCASKPVRIKTDKIQVGTAVPQKQEVFKK